MRWLISLKLRVAASALPLADGYAADFDPSNNFSLLLEAAAAAADDDDDDDDDNEEDKVDALFALLDRVSV